MSNFKRVAPYESHLIAAADEVIRLRGLVAAQSRVIVTLTKDGWDAMAANVELRRHGIYACVATFALGLLAGGFL